ncbi:MAG: hypothetical protein ACFFC7_15950 [Candidatus Hermodarchaeota archaeon]
MSGFEELVLDWGMNLLNWYLETFMVFVSFEMLLLQLELLVIVYLILQALGFLFPGVGRLVTAIFLPFRIIHVWLHLNAAKKLDLQTPDSEESLIITRFFTSINTDDRTSLGIKAPKNTQDAYRIATAPTKGAIMLIVLSFLLSPILVMFGAIGLFIHLYILLGSLTTLSADIKDYLFVYQIVLFNADLSPRYLAWSIPLFAVAVLSTFLMVSDVIKSFLTGISIVILYLLLLLALATRFSKSGRSISKLEFMPYIENNALFSFPEIILPTKKNN